MRLLKQMLKRLGLENMTLELNESTDKMPLDKFLWDKNAKTLTAEASDFGPLANGRWWMVDIFKGLAIKGIFIRSHFTGKVECFRFSRNIYSGSGEDREQVGIVFCPVNEQCKIKLVTIYND